MPVGLRRVGSLSGPMCLIPVEPGLHRDDEKEVNQDLPGINPSLLRMALT